MAKPKRGDPLQIVEYREWFHKYWKPFAEVTEEFQAYGTSGEREFLRDVIFPMFYDEEEIEKRTANAFPYVLDNFSGKGPKYIIDNDRFTMIFFKYIRLSGKWCWEVSFHVKDHEFCDRRIVDFKNWFFKHYFSIMPDMQLDQMPRFFKYPRLGGVRTESKDFCVEFWNSYGDPLLFKLCDTFRFH